MAPIHATFVGPYAGLLLGAMRAAGHEDPAERETILKRLRESEGFSESMKTVSLLEERAQLHAQMGPREFLAACVAALPPEEHERALRDVLSVIIADGRVSDAERDYFAVLNGLLDSARS